MTMVVRTMTPKDRLSPVDKNALLSSILKFFLPGKYRTMRSTHIIEASRLQFLDLVKFSETGRFSLPWG
jgi:hypothetical protein